MIFLRYCPRVGPRVCPRVQSRKEPKPIGSGVFGDIYDQFKGRAKAAIDFLMRKKSGEAVGALHHKDIGYIDLVWGDAKAGLQKIMDKHPEVIDNLQDIIDNMKIAQTSDNRIKLESATHFAVVSRDWLGEKRTPWLLTAYEKKESSVTNNRMDTADTLSGERNDTATPQNTASEGEDTSNAPIEQEIEDNSAMNRIPRDEKTGEPLFEQAETPDLAWDAIVEQTEGDEAMAQTVADGMVADKRAALDKAEKAKSKGGNTVTEKIAAEKERKAAIEKARNELAIWELIAGTAARRAQEAAEMVAAESAVEEEVQSAEQSAGNVSEENAGSSELVLGEKKDREGNTFYERNGNIDLWDISELLKNARRESAPVRLTDRNVRHIMNEHKKEFAKNEQSVFDFLEDVFSSARILRKARAGAMFVVVENANNDKVAIIKLMPSEHGDYYNIESAGFYRKDKWKESEEIIGELSEPTQSEATLDVSKPQNPQQGGEEVINTETQKSSSTGKLSKSSETEQESVQENAVIPTLTENSDSSTSNRMTNSEATEAVLEMLEDAGIEVVMDTQEMAAVLEANERLQEMKKSALESTSALQGEHHPAVTSSSDTAKLLNSLRKLAKEYEEKDIKRTDNFIKNVAISLNMPPTGRRSQYGTFETKNGKIVTIRLSDHNSSVSNYDNAGVRDGISIIITSAPNKGITNDGEAHVTEIYYNAIKLRKADGKPLAEIVRSIEQALYSGEYKDTTGLAEVEEVNPLQLMTVYHGSGAAFDAFDHSHMGEGEGAQAYGWGTYVTEVEGIARSYAEQTSKVSDKQRENKIINTIVKDTIERHGGDVNKAIEEYESLLKESWSDKKRVKAGLKILRTGRYLPEGRTNLYTVEIPEDNGKNYLVWNESLENVNKEELAESIVATVEQNKTGIDETEHEMLVNDIKDSLDEANTGEKLYKAISLYLGDKAASEFLSNAGFAGIKYPAQYQTGGRKDNAKNYVIFNEADAKITERIQFLRTERGEVYGFVKNGKIYLDPKLLNPNTPIHEYTHIWDMALQKSNPELWARGVELMKQTPLWDEVKNNPAYADIAEDENLIASEVHARLTGKEGAALLERLNEEAKKETDFFKLARKISLVENLRRWINEAWKWIKDTMTPWTKEEADAVSLEEFVNMPIADLARKAHSDSPIMGRDAEDTPVQYRYVKFNDRYMSENAMEALEDGKTDVGLNLEFAHFIEDNGLGTFYDEYHHVGKNFNKHYFVTLNDGVTLAKARKAYKEYIQEKARKKTDELLAKYPNAKPKEQVIREGGRVFPEKDPTHEEVGYIPETNTFWYVPESDSVHEGEGNVLLNENNSVYSQAYTTENGERISYGRGTTSLEGEDGNGVQGEKWSDLLLGQLRDGEFQEGEFCNVERRFSESGAFSFVAGEKIETYQDVAYIFRQLENKAVENSFAALVKDGKVTVLHLGMGSQTQTAIDIDAIVAADNKLNADKIYFVHNHPSGYIVCSQADKSVFSDIKKRVGDKLQDGIIINTTRGVFGTFNDHTSTVEHEYADIDGANPIKTYSFDTQVFAPGYVPIIHQAGSAEDVVTFICSHRLGDRSKISVLIANNTLSIVGNVFTPFTEIDNDNYKDVVRFAVDNALLMGGRSVFLYGDFKNNSDYSLKKEFEKYNIRLNDIITIKGNNSNYYQSGFDDGGLFEPETAYGRTERAGRTALDPKAQITIVEARDNEFSNFDEAREWAKKNIARTYSNEETGGKGEIQISNNAINKYLSESSVDKSDSKDVHLSVLKVLPDVIRESIDAEQHPDYNKKDGIRKPENGANPNVTIHRLYGAVRIGRSTFRVKVTLKEYIDKNQPNVPHSYEATKIELLAGTLVDAESTDPNTNNSISVANLLNGVEKSYGKGEKIIENPRIEEEKDVLLMEAVDYHRAMAKDSYEREVSSTTSKLNEAWVDSMASLKTLQDSVAEATGKPIRDFENAYLAENRMSSSNLAEIEEYRRTLFKAITDEVNVLVSKGLKYDDLIDYLMAKHGLERNEVLAIRDAEAKIADKVSELEKRKKKREIT